MITSAFIVPHPPILLAEIGNGEEQKAKNTIQAYREVANTIAEQKPETIVIISSHAPSYADYIHISSGDSACGDMAKFHHPEIKTIVTYDQPMIKCLSTYLRRNHIAAGTRGDDAPTLDHGTMVPLYFINQQYTDYELVLISVSGLSAEDHDALGQCIRIAAEELERSIVVIASGDLSHCLSEDSPYGFHLAGAEFDQMAVQAMKQNDFSYFMKTSQADVINAKQCGLPTFQILNGVMRNCNFISKFLSYEHPFGIGYAICAFMPQEADPYLALAREAITLFLQKGKTLPLPNELPMDLQKRSGVFVSLHQDDSLRGCVGSLTPLHPNIASEIIHNAIHAAVHDQRFPALTFSELSKIRIEVDVISRLEPIFFLDELDPSKYGLYVTSGNRSAVLLPHLPGIQNAEEQLQMVLQKGNIHPNDFYTMERFTVTRHQ